MLRLLCKYEYFTYSEGAVLGLLAGAVASSIIVIQKPEFGLARTTVFCYVDRKKYVFEQNCKVSVKKQTAGIEQNPSSRRALVKIKLVRIQNKVCTSLNLSFRNVSRVVFSLRGFHDKDVRNLR